MFVLSNTIRSPYFKDEDSMGIKSIILQMLPGDAVGTVHMLDARKKPLVRINLTGAVA
jgi:hypothetical protein